MTKTGWSRALGRPREICNYLVVSTWQIASKLGFRIWEGFANSALFCCTWATFFYYYFFFSLLENSVRNSQARVMENFNEALLTLRYNKRIFFFLFVYVSTMEHKSETLWAPSISIIVKTLSTMRKTLSADVWVQGASWKGAWRLAKWLFHCPRVCTAPVQRVLY